METDIELGASTGAAFVFPGMGPLPFGDVAKFMLINPVARQLIARANERLGYSLIDRYRETEGDYSEYAQVTFLVSCVALTRWAEDELGAEANLCTGASFGGKAAAVHSGALSFEDGVWLTARFARCLEEYFAEEHRDAVTQSFARTSQEALGSILAELDAEGEWYEITCYVDEDFLMLTLREHRIEWLQQRLRAAGGLPLYVMRPPLHASAFEGLRRMAEAEVIGHVTFADPRIPVVADHDGTLLTTADGVRTMLLDGCVRPVRWPSVISTLRARGVRKLYIAGPDALFGRVAITTQNFEVVTLNPRLALRPRRRSAASAVA